MRDQRSDDYVVVVVLGIVTKQRKSGSSQGCRDFQARAQQHLYLSYSKSSHVCLSPS
jgi:hypothetical protein